MQTHDIASFTAAAEQDTTQYIVSALQNIQCNVECMKSTLESVDQRTHNNAARLEAIEMLLRSKQLESVSVPAAPQPKADSDDWQWNHMIASAAVASLLLYSPSLRRFVQRGLKTVPLSVLLGAQIGAASACGYWRGREYLSCSTESVANAAKRRQLCYALLLASLAAVPAKGLAHALPDARRRIGRV